MDEHDVLLGHVDHKEVWRGSSMIRSVFACIDVAAVK
jgi:hypothetical protein